MMVTRGHMGGKEREKRSESEGEKWFSVTDILRSLEVLISCWKNNVIQSIC